MGDRWLNREAMEWVLYESDVAGDQLALLLATASFTDREGRGAHPARMTLAQLIRRDRSTVARGLAALVKHGHLLQGDWRRVLHIRSDRRPNVYDLPDGYRLWITRERGRDLPPRDESTGAHLRTDGGASTRPRGRKSRPEQFPKGTGTRRGGARPPDAPPAPVDNPRGETLCRTCGNRLDSAYHRNVCKADEQTSAGPTRGEGEGS